MANWLTATVTDRHQWTPRLCSLKLSLALPPFEAGQFVNLGLEINGKATTRPYSLVSPPEAGLHEIFFSRVPNGSLSNQLFDLTVGETLLSAPRAGGFFTLSQVPAAQHLWLCATGTAIGPYLSMLRTPDPWESFERVILLHGVRDHSEMAYLDVLQEIKQRHGHQFDYFHSVTRETETLHFSRRIPELLDTGELEDAAGLTLDPETAQVMLCGGNGMINGCLAALTARGFKKNQRRDPGQITIEIYQ